MIYTYLPCTSPQGEDSRGNDGDHSLRVALESAVTKRGNHLGDAFNPANLVDVLPAQQWPDSHHKIQFEFDGKFLIIKLIRRSSTFHHQICLVFFNTLLDSAQ